MKRNPDNFLGVIYYISLLSLNVIIDDFKFVFWSTEPVRETGVKLIAAEYK